jgi:hypothetical protein
LPAKGFHVIAVEACLSRLAASEKLEDGRLADAFSFHILEIKIRSKEALNTFIKCFPALALGQLCINEEPCPQRLSALSAENRAPKGFPLYL